MPFCPNCEAEYQPGIEACSDCGLLLVPALTAESKVHDTSDAEMLVCRRFRNAAEAAMAREFLEQADIRCFVKGESDTITAIAGFNQVELFVDERDLGRAEDLLRACMEASVELPDEGDAPNDAEVEA